MSVYQPGEGGNTTAARQEYIPPLPPGKVGELANFIYKHAPYPNAGIAIAAALALMSAICGQFVNVSGSGLTIWQGIIGGSGIGKEAGASGISKLVAIAAKSTPAITDFIGPSNIASAEAAHKRLARTPSVLVTVGELGLKLKQWCSLRASPVHSNLVAFLLNTFGKSGSGYILGAQENSDRDKGAPPVESPNLVMLGDTTETTFLEAQSDALIGNGFSARWILAWVGDKRQPFNETRELIPPAWLTDYLAALAASSLAHQQRREVIDASLSPEAKDIDAEIERFTTGRINGSSSEVVKKLYSRSRLHILKVATLLAIGEWESELLVRSHHILWARDYVFAGIERLIAKFERGEVGEQENNHLGQQREVMRLIKLYNNNPFDDTYHGSEPMHKMGVITHSHIQQRLASKSIFRNDRQSSTEAIKRAVKSLLEADIIQELPPSQMKELFGVKPRAYIVVDPKPFMDLD